MFIVFPQAVRESGFRDPDKDGTALKFSFAARQNIKPTDQFDLAQGIVMDGTVSILGWMCSAYVEISQNKVKFDLKTDPLTLGGVLALYKSSTEQSKGPEFLLEASPTLNPSAMVLNIHGYAKLLGIWSAETSVVIDGTQMTMDFETSFFGTTLRLYLASQWGARVDDYFFTVKLVHEWSKTNLINAIKDFMNVAGKAMDSAQDALDSADKKLEEAKAKTCEAINKHCPKIKGSCGWFAFICKAWNWIADKACDAACAVAKGVLSMAQGVLRFASATLEVIKRVAEFVVDFLTKILEAVMPVNKLKISFEGNADLSFKRPTSLEVEIALEVIDYYATVKNLPSINAVYFPEFKIHFAMDFTNLLKAFTNMARSVVKRMMGSGSGNSEKSEQGKKFVDYVDKKQNRPPDVMKKDKTPGACTFAPNTIGPNSPGRNPASGKCGEFSDCAHYWGWKSKKLSCGTKPAGAKCKRASECQSWLCIDDPNDKEKNCLSKASANRTLLENEEDIEAGDCLKGVCAAPFKQCPKLTDRKFDLVCYMPNWAQYRHPNQIREKDRRYSWRPFLVPERIDPCVCTHYLYSFARIGVPVRHTGVYANATADQPGNYWKTVPSELSDYTIDEYESIPGTLSGMYDHGDGEGEKYTSGLIKNKKGKLVKPEAWFNEGGWNMMHRFNRHIKKLNPQAKTLLSLGGWDEEFTQAIGLIAREINGCNTTKPLRSEFPNLPYNFPDPVSDAERIKIVDCSQNPSTPSRSAFVEHLHGMCCKYGFDGADIDWEYPAKVGWVSREAPWIGSPYDRKGLTTLMKDIRTYFDENPCPNNESSSPFSRNRYLIITSAVTPAEERIKAGYEQKELGKYEEFIGIMSYDFHGAWDKETSPQAPLYLKEFNSDTNNWEDTPLRNSDGTVKTDDDGNTIYDQFTIQRGNSWWNSPDGDGAMDGLNVQQTYTGFSTYGRGWTLPYEITSIDQVKYGLKTKCNDDYWTNLGQNKPSCCNDIKSCNANKARSVTKEDGCTTLPDLWEEQEGVWDSSMAFRRYDPGTVTAIAAYKDQFISYDTWETLAIKAVWMRDEYLKYDKYGNEKRRGQTGRFGGGIVWSIDTDDFNNGMPHHWAIACYLESNYYLSQHPNCKCEFWKNWAPPLPGAPADILTKFEIMPNETVVNERRRLGEKDKFPDPHPRYEHSGDHNIAAYNILSEERFKKHEKDAQEIREKRHMSRHGRRLTGEGVPDGNTFECSADISDHELFPIMPYYDNCNADAVRGDNCPAPNGILNGKEEKIYNKTTGELIGTIPAETTVLHSDTREGNDFCKMLYRRTYYFMDGCYNLVNASELFYLEDKIANKLRVGVWNGSFYHMEIAETTPNATDYDCSASIPAMPPATADVDDCYGGTNTTCSVGEDCFGTTYIPNVTSVDNSATCGNQCPRRFTRIWSVSDLCGNTRTYTRKIYVCDGGNCDHDDIDSQVADGSVYNCDTSSGGAGYQTPAPTTTTAAPTSGSINWPSGVGCYDQAQSTCGNGNNNANVFCNNVCNGVDPQANQKVFYDCGGNRENCPVTTTAGPTTTAAPTSGSFDWPSGVGCENQAQEKCSDSANDDKIFCGNVCNGVTPQANQKAFYDCSLTRTYCPKTGTFSWPSLVGCWDQANSADVCTDGGNYDKIFCNNICVNGQAPNAGDTVHFDCSRTRALCP